MSKFAFSVNKRLKVFMQLETGSFVFADTMNLLFLAYRNLVFTFFKGIECSQYCNSISFRSVTINFYFITMRDCILSLLWPWVSVTFILKPQSLFTLTWLEHVTQEAFDGHASDCLSEEQFLDCLGIDHAHRRQHKKQLSEPNLLAMKMPAYVVP